MTTRLLLPTLLLFLASCAPESTNSDGPLPTDLESLRQVRAQVKSDLAILETKLEAIDNKIQEISPVTIKTPILVTTTQVEKSDYRHFVDMQAVVQSDEVVRLSSEASGRIVSIPVKEGQNVRRGQLIARLDLDILTKQKAELETSLSLANDVFERQQRLWDQKIGTELQYLQAKNNKERLENSIQVLNHQMSKANVYAPTAGVVEKLMMEEGEMSSPGFPIAEIVNTNNLKVVADLPENYLKSVRRGEKVMIYFPALGDSTKGVINLVGRTIDPSNRTFKVEVDIKNSEGYLKPNLLASMKINDFTKEDVITIDPEMLQQEVGGRNFVFLVKEDNGEFFAEKRYIITGTAADNAIVVDEGLNPGDQIIVKGSRGLTDGDPIEITASKTATNG